MPRNFDKQEDNTRTQSYHTYLREEPTRFDRSGHSSINHRKRKRNTDSPHERLSHAEDRCFQRGATRYSPKKIKRQSCLDFRNRKNRCHLLNEIYELSFSQNEPIIILSKLFELQGKHTASYFSEVLQHTFYRLQHTDRLAGEKAYVRKVLSAILEKFALNLFQVPDFWIDPEQGYTALMASVSACEKHDQQLGIDLLKHLNAYFSDHKQDLSALIQIKNTSLGASVFMIACRRGLTEVVSALLQTAKNVLPTTKAFQDFLTQQDNAGFSPLNTSCAGGHLPVVQELLEIAERELSPDEFKAFLTHENKDGFSPLNASCKARSLPIVQELLKVAERKLSPDEFKAFLTHKDSAGFSSLNTSCKAGELPVVRALLDVAERKVVEKELSPDEFKAFLTHKNNAGFSPLNTSCAAGHLSVVRELLAVAEKKIAEKKLSPDAFQNFLTNENNDGFSSLNASCTEGYLPIVQALLDVAKIKLSLDAFQNFLTNENKNGFSPLNASCKKGSLRVVQELLDVAEKKLSPDEFKAFLTHENKDGFSPLNASCKEGRLPVVQELLDVAEKKLSPDEFKAFLTHKDSTGFSSLNTSCKEGRLPVVQKLLKAAKRELSPDAFFAFLIDENSAGFSPLNTSCSAGHSEIVKCLVRAWRELDEHDEDFNKQAFIKFIEQKNRHGFTPLNAAAKAARELARSVDNKRKQDYTDILAYLLSLGANPDEPNKSGYTARRNFITYKWPREDEMGSTNEPKKYLSSAPRHGNALFFRPVPPAKPSYYSVHHYRRVHHYRP